MTHRVLISDELAPEGLAVLARHPSLEVDDRPGLPAAASSS